MKKLLSFAAVLIIALIVNAAEAKEVTVDGTGTDRDSALRDARRLAVEQVVGTFVDSRTLTKNYMVELDNVYTKSTGFVGKVNILSEGMVNGIYKIRATIDVAENPSPEILQQVQAVMALNDPRIAVAVFKSNSTTHEEAIESAIMERLITLNFTHVIDPNVVAGLHNAQMLNDLYNGRPVNGVGSSFGADFIVLAKSSTTSKEIKIPNFKGGYLDTGLNNGQTELVAKIIRLDTGDILETFTVETSGIGEGTTTAEREALKNMANQAAAKVEEKFRRIGSRSSSGLQIIAITSDYHKVQALASDLRNLPGVQSVYIREHNGGRAILDIDSSQSMDTVILLLSSRSSVNFVIESTSGNTARLRL